jgi:hypothetical protein
MPDDPLALLGELTKPAIVLIEKISDAVGGIFRPYQMLRVAKAEAAVEELRVESAIHITDLHRRAMRRFLEEEAKKQANIEEITATALPLLSENSRPRDVNDDWITNFFDKSRIVSDSDMQELWARILAGEANSPGNFSRGTVNLLADLVKSDAQLFSTLCSFRWNRGSQPALPLIYDPMAEIYKKNGLFFAGLSHLEALTLIHLDPHSGFILQNQPKDVTLGYFGKDITLTLPTEPDNILDVGMVFPTRAGIELATVCRAQPVEGFADYIIEKWRSMGLAPKKSGAGWP